MHPANEIEVDAEIVETIINLTEAYDNGYVEVFNEMQRNIIEEANHILYCLESVDSGLAGKVRRLIEKLK
jgi:hypothetical protein